MTAILEKRIVTVGGGTGGFTINRGLVQYLVHTTAICTTFDSGGSTGRLRDEFGALPQGDIRRCLLALAEQEGDGDLRKLFEHRFEGNGTHGITDHSLGNLLLLAAEKEFGRVEGVRRIAKLLGVRGDVLPVSIDDADLMAELSGGATIKGESVIDTRSIDDPRSIRRVWLEPEAYICREAAEALQRASVIVLGPGDLYTSVIPNLLVKGFVEAVQASSAKVAFVVNLMTKPAETRGFSAKQFVETLFEYGLPRIDVMLVNDAPIPEKLIERYREDGSEVIRLDSEWGRGLPPLIRADLLSEEGLHLKDPLIRHDSHKLARRLMSLL